MTSSPDQPFVRLQGVSKSYGAGRNQVRVLDGVDLELRSGDQRLPGHRGGRDGVVDSALSIGERGRLVVPGMISSFMAIMD